MAARVCEIEGCGRRSHGASDVCESHRWRLRVHGDVLPDVPIGQLRDHVPDWSAEDRWLEAVRVAYEPSAAEGHGLLWLV